jgi:hypothetical protein
MITFVKFFNLLSSIEEFEIYSIFKIEKIQNNNVAKAIQNDYNLNKNLVVCLGVYITIPVLLLCHNEIKKFDMNHISVIFQLEIV